MDLPAYNPVVTVVDVLEVGACIDGVKNFVVSHGGLIAGLASDFPDEPYVQNAANALAGAVGDGDGDGGGYG